jgi:hypothetical protein
MIQLTPEAKRNLKQRIAQMGKYGDFKKAQRKLLNKVGNQLRADTRSSWAAAPYKRRKRRGSVRAAIIRSFRPIIRNIGYASLRLSVGASVKTNKKARLVNVLDPGFTPKGSRKRFFLFRRVRGFNIRPKMYARARQLIKPFGVELRRALAAQIGATP